MIEHLPAILTILVVLGMFVMFIREIYPPEIIAMAAALLLLLLGVVEGTDIQKAFSNSAPWTIAAMFIISGALTRTGTISGFSHFLEKQAEKGKNRALLLIAAFVLLGSAFMNNTPIVVIMIPVIVKLAPKLGYTASKLLIPLSYVTIVGGIMTLIGTSTNLLVDGVAREAGLEPFTLFEITPLAIILACVVLLVIRLYSMRVLPDNRSVLDMIGNRKQMKFFTEVAVPEGSPVIGRKVRDVDLFKREGMSLIDVLRGDESLRRSLNDVLLEVGDRVVLRTGVNELLSLKQSRALAMVDQLSSRKTTTVEALISPGCALVGRSLGALRLRRRYGVYPLAVHRRNQNIGRKMDEIVIKVGDTLLLEGAAEDIERLASDVDLVDISEPSDKAYRRDRAPIVLAIMIGVVALASFNIAPIFVLAAIGAVLVMLVRAIDPEEAFELIEGPLLALIFSMLVIGMALEKSGAVELIVSAISPVLAELPHFAIIFGVFLCTTILTELVSNNAIAVVMTPIAIALAKQIGVDPRPLVITVMIAASCAFSTPIGYQTNTLVYGPGGYKFTDFVKAGLPINITVMIVSSLLIPLFWPL